jgi:hypothetical protein
VALMAVGAVTHRLPGQRLVGLHVMKNVIVFALNVSKVLTNSPVSLKSEVVFRLKSSEIFSSRCSQTSTELKKSNTRSP